MGRGRIASVAGAGMVALATLLVAGCGDVAAKPPGMAPASSMTAGGNPPNRISPPVGALGFIVHKDAVQWPAPAGGYVPPGLGLEALVPDGQRCVFGIGVYRNGYQDVGARWTGSADCTRLTISPSPASGSWRAGGGGEGSVGMAAPVALRWTDGSLIEVGDRVTRVPPGGAPARQLASLGLPVPQDPRSESADQGAATAAIQVGDRLLIGGGEMRDRSYQPVVWISDDVGATLRQVGLPIPPGAAGRTGIAGLAVHGREVVAVGGNVSNAMDRAVNATGQVPVWYSADAGAHWAVSVVDGVSAGGFLRGVLRLRDGWLAYGFTQRSGAADRPILLASLDGMSWTRAGGSTATALGLGDVYAATVDTTGRPVLVGGAIQPRKNPNTDPVYCGAVWTAGPTGTSDWQRGDLGCGAAPPQTAATLPDGRVLLAGNRDLWIRTR